ncbi:hypothetical protein BD309DRAFT_878341 [Dichomitus squalens]|nr:hypothetical protein BD309DRAFT_878341 [Dichomitus squalens]
MSSPHPPSPSQSIRLRLFVLSSTISTDHSTTPVAIYWQWKDEDNSGRRTSRVAIAEEGRDDSDGATSARASRLLRPSRRAAGKTHKKAAEQWSHPALEADQAIEVLKETVAEEIRPAQEAASS